NMKNSGRPLFSQQRIEPAGEVQRAQIVETADMAVVDIDLRHRTAAGPLHHDDALLGLEIDAYLGHADPLARQQPLRIQAVRAVGAGVHDDVGHVQPFTTGSLAAVQALRPPSRLCSWLKPCLRRMSQALSERTPPWQLTRTGLSL